MRSVAATRYVLPLREGGSLPAIVEADDLQMYVVKFRGAGQGPLALVAELLAGGIGQALGLPIPELVRVDLSSSFGRSEPDPEIRHLLRESAGLNFGMRYLPGAVNFDLASGDTASAELASMTVWFDAFVQNVDRTPRNPNLLLWQGRLSLIDHGASLYFHHAEGSFREKARSPFSSIREHVLLREATGIAEAGERARALLTTEVLERWVATLPDDWLRRTADAAVSDESYARQQRTAYLDYFAERLRSAAIFETEAIRAQRSDV